MSRYECTLSPELLDKAVNELNEPRDNVDRLKAIDELKASYNEEKYGPIASTDDKFLLRFLRAKKFDQKKALLALNNYHDTRRSFSEVFDKVNNPVLIQEIVDCGVIIAIDGAGKDGSCVVLERDGLITKGMDMYGLTAYGVLTMEKLLESEQNQICGLQTVNDFEGFNISIITKISPAALSRMNSIMQDAMPLRIKAMHMFNEGKIMDVLMSIMKLFLKEKLMKRIHVHGKDPTKMKEFIKMEKMPPSFGGTGPPIEEVVKDWNESMFGEDTYL